MDWSVHWMESLGSATLVRCECLNGFLFDIIFFNWSWFLIYFRWLWGRFQQRLSWLRNQRNLPKQMDGCFYFAPTCCLPWDSGFQVRFRGLEAGSAKGMPDRQLCLTISNWCGIRLPHAVIVRAVVESVNWVMSSTTKGTVAWGMACGTDTRKMGVMASSIVTGLVRQRLHPLLVETTASLALSQSWITPKSSSSIIVASMLTPLELTG